MPVIMSPNLKRERYFIKNGKVYKGGIEEAISGQMGNDLGAVGQPDKLPISPKKD